MDDRLYEWSSVIAAELINLHLQHDPGACKAILFQQVQSLIHDALRVIEMESRDRMLTPSEN